MRELFTQHTGLAGALLVASFVLIVLLLLLVHRLRWRRSVALPRAKMAAPCRPAVATPVVKRDAAALLVAVQEAETRREEGRLPGLYLSLAQCRIEVGETKDAEELLRKSIRGAASAELKDTHARARLALGDLAHRNGDLTTACEHWQIARALFHELKQTRDHEAAESRMLRNGCPTDWVLTDF